MQHIVIQKPYKFVPPHYGAWWPTVIQRFRLIDIWLRRSHGIVAYECRHVNRLQDSIHAGHAVLLTPNHARACDPVAMGFLTREVPCNAFAMASWHLYHQGWLTRFAIKKMGAFSVNREGIDRQAIQTAIDILASAKRPLIIFPEGGVTKTNDRLNALLEGVAFVARSSAKKRRQKNPQEKVVVHPIALKYLLQSEIGEAIDPAMTEIERRLAWRPQKDVPLLERVRRIGLALLTLKEMEYFAEPQSGTTEERLSGLVDRLLAPLEIEWLGKASHIGVIARVKALRMKIIPAMIQGDLQPSEERRRWRQLEDIYLAQQVASYPHDYIHNQPTVDRILETVERFQEDLTDETTVMGDLKIVIEVGEPITVEPQRDRAAAEDPLMKQIAHDLQEMLDRLARESPIWEASSNR